MLKNPLGTSTAALIMVFVMLPFFLLAMYERNGQPLEKAAKNMANVLFIRSKQRPYRTNNFYSCLMKQDKLDKKETTDSSNPCPERATATITALWKHSLEG